MGYFDTTEVMIKNEGKKLFKKKYKFNGCFISYKKIIINTQHCIIINKKQNIKKYNFLSFFFLISFSGDCFLMFQST